MVALRMHKIDDNSIYVVDDLGNSVKFYATNQLLIYNEKETEARPAYLSTKNTSHNAPVKPDA